MNKILRCPEDKAIIDSIMAKVESTEIMNPCATHDFVRKACEHAKKYHYGFIVPFRQYLPDVIENLKGTSIKIVEGFSDMPLQGERMHTFETGLQMGVSELDFIGRLSLFFEGRYDEFQDEIRETVDMANKYGAPVKVIIETGFLTDKEKILISRLALEAGATFIKCCLGVGLRKGRGTIHDILLLKETFGDGIKIKASGGIASLEDAYAMIRAGADRVAMRAMLAGQLESIGYDPDQ